MHNVVHLKESTKITIHDNPRCNHLAITQETLAETTLEADGSFDWIVTGTREDLILAFESGQPVEFYDKQCFLVDIDRGNANWTAFICWSGDDNEEDEELDGEDPTTYVVTTASGREAILTYLRSPGPSKAN